MTPQVILHHGDYDKVANRRLRSQIDLSPNVLVSEENLIKLLVFLKIDLSQSQKC